LEKYQTKIIQKCKEKQINTTKSLLIYDTTDIQKPFARKMEAE